MIINSMVGLLHHKVKFNGYKLDIAYITPQLIASAMPSDQFFQRFYRMDANVLVKFLNEKHEGNWHIWNLQETQELGYNTENIGGSGKTTAVSRIPIPDHRPISFSTLISVITDIRDYLEKDAKNTALVHCKCGKGRTGTVSIAYLMLFHGMSYEKATNDFTHKRIRLGIVDGISIKSQRRYLQYLEKWIQSNQDPVYTNLNSIRISKVIIRNPKMDDFELKLTSLADASTESPNKPQWNITFKEKYYVLTPLDVNSILFADLWLSYTGYQRKVGYQIPICNATYAFNVNFEPNEGRDAQVSIEQVTPLDGTKVSTTQSISSNNDHRSGSCVCLWDELDGIGGLGFRGYKGFDSIEVFWTRNSEHAELLAKVDCFKPCSVNSFHEKI